MRLVVAQSITPQAWLHAQSAGIHAVEVDYEGLKEVDSGALRLF
ncbi:MAG: hypothetical protein ACT4OP_09180 [Actinomycetota bacterium]